MARHAAVDGHEVVVGGPADRQAAAVDDDVAGSGRRDRSRAGRPAARRLRDAKTRVSVGRSAHRRSPRRPSLGRGDRPVAPARPGRSASANRASTRMSARSTRVGDEVDARPVDEGVAVRPGERRARRRRARTASVAVMSPNAARSAGMEVDDEAVRHERAVGVVRRSASIARSIRRWSWTAGARPEEARRRALEEAFEEPLDGGEGRHGRSRSLPEGPREPGPSVDDHP